MTLSHERDPILLHAKISPPVARMNLVARQRLVESLEDGARGRLTLLIAPAGFGKTTTLSQWAQQTVNATAWLSLGEADNDPVRFWRYAGQALADALPPETSERALQLVRTAPSLSVSTFLDALLHELDLVEQPTSLVLDDFHVVKDPGIHDGLVYFIAHMPPTLHLVIASRNELPFPTVQWRLRNELTTVDAEQMKFTLSESETFYRETAGLPLSPGHVARLREQTEGWIAGLQLLAISLRRATDYDRFIAGFTGYNRDIADYLFHEVMSGLPADMQSFLLRTSVLERLDASVCNDITGRTDGARMLEQLKAWNLFLQPLDDRDSAYRYHHLFAEFLRNLAGRQQPDLQAAAHLAASRSLAARGYMDEAIDHAFASRDYLAAADYLSRHIADVLQRGEFPTLLRWFDCFPDAVDVTPELSLLHAFVLVVTGQAERAERQLARIERHYSGMEPGPERRQVQSGLLFVRSNLVFASGQFAQWFAFSEGILDELLPHSPIFYSFNYNKSEPLVRRTAFGLHGALSPETETIGKLFSGVLEKHGWGDSLINLYVLQSMAEGFYEWNRLEESQALLHRLERVPRLRHIPGLYVPARITQAYLYAATGRPELARDAVEEATAAALELPETHWAASLRACRLRLHLMLGELPAAKVAAEALHLSARDKPTFNREYEYIAFARFLGARHKEAEALRLLELLQPQALRENSLASRVEIAIAQACLQEQRGQRSLALVALHEALAIGEANGYVRSFVDAGNAVAKLLQLYAAQAQQPDAATVFAPEPATAAYVQRLLAAFPVMQQQGAAAPAPSSAPVEPLSRTELELLQLIREGESNRRIAARLHLSVGTVKVYVSRLYGKLGVSSRTQALARAQEWRLLREE